jgi:hypothetical protein
MLNDETLMVTYTIQANSYAKDGTYLLNVYGACPGELVTVGKSPYLGTLPWDNRYMS